MTAITVALNAAIIRMIKKQLEEIEEVKAITGKDQSLPTWNYFALGAGIIELLGATSMSLPILMEKEQTTFDKDTLTYVKTNQWRISALFSKPQLVLWKDVSKIVLQKKFSIDHKKKEVIDEMYVELFDNNDQLLCNSNGVYLSNHSKDALLFV
ncbi:hypothetical protein JKY79_03345 [Candidatus Babeliales bacterium]|nr:hypothetical protein [Candidatus Babeliales bacterium]